MTINNIYQEIYLLCNQISTQQKHIFDVLQAEFPDMYEKERLTLVRNSRTLTNQTKKIAQIIGEAPSLEAKTSPNVDNNNLETSSLQKILNDPALFNKLSIYLSSFAESEDELKDIVQDAILKAYENRHEYSDIEGGSPMAWIYRLAQNNAINYIRKKKRYQELKYNSNSESTQEERMDQLVQKIGGNETEKNDSESKKKFFKQINRVLAKTLNQHEISLLLSLAKGEKYEEIAAKLEIPVGTVKSGIFIARKKMLPYLNYFKTQLEE